MDERQSGILAEFLEIDRTIKKHEAEIKEQKATRSNLEQLLLQEMDGAKIERLTSQGRTVFPREVLGVTIDQERREQLLEAVKAHGLDHLVTVQPARLKTVIQEWLADGDESIPQEIRECVRLFPHRRLTVRSS